MVAEPPRRRAVEPPEPFLIAYVDGVTPAKWARIWADRRPDRALQLVATDADQTGALHAGGAQMAFVRLPVDQTGLNIIPLYRETAVAVVTKEHAVAAVDELTIADLADETVHPASGAIDETFALIAAGVGVVVVPQSIARMHARRDLTYRPVTDAPPTQIALAWLAENDDGVDAAAIEEFIGIVRGRTARSSRGGTASEIEPAAQKKRTNGSRTDKPRSNKPRTNKPRTNKPRRKP